MLSRVSKQIALQFAVRRIINEEDIEVYEYGINILLTGIVNMVSIIIIGILCGKVIECICFMIMFIPLRQYVGCYHSATPKRCFTCTLMMILIVLSAMENIPWNVYIIWGLLIICGTVIYSLSPVEAKNKPLNDMEKCIYRRKSIIIWCMEMCAAMICTIVKIERININMCIAMAHTVTAIILLLGKTQLWLNIRKQKNN